MPTSATILNIRPNGERPALRVKRDGEWHPTTWADYQAGVFTVGRALMALGLEPGAIKAGLESVAPVDGRLRRLEGSNGASLYDDSYNANPLSVVAAAEFLASLPGRNWFVLGDMFELGDDARELHRRVGAELRRAGVDRLAATGDLSQAAWA